MDIVKLESIFMKNIVSKIIKKLLKKKFNCDVEIKLNDFSIVFNNEKANINLNIDGELNKSELVSILKTFNF